MLHGYVKAATSSVVCRQDTLRWRDLVLLRDFTAGKEWMAGILNNSKAASSMIVELASTLQCAM